MMNDFEITELDRRISNLIQIGTIAEADYEKAKLKVIIGNIITDWLPWLTRRAGSDSDWWAPEVGEQVVILSPSGELKQAVILPSIYQSAYPAIDDSPDISKFTYKDGTIIKYNRLSHKMDIDIVSSGSIEIKVGNSKIFMDGSSIKISSDRIDLN